MLIKLNKERIFFYIAAAVAVIALLIYIFLGRPDLERGKRELINNNPSVQSVSVSNEAEGQSIITVECTDGSTYEIYYPPGETNFEALRASKCGTNI